MQESQIHVLYEADAYFQEDFGACKNPINRDRVPWNVYMLQDGLLFKNIQLCIPKSSMRDTLI